MLDMLGGDDIIYLSGPSTGVRKMDIARILEVASGIAQIGEPMWSFVRDEIIPNEDERRAMKVAALKMELAAGRGGHREVSEYRVLRKFLATAPVGVCLSVGTTIAEDGTVIAWPNPHLCAVA
jgi:hypothetical protein